MHVQHTTIVTFIRQVCTPITHYKIKDHYFKALVGMNTEEYVYRETCRTRPDVISSLIPEISAATGEDKINSSKYNDWSTAGFFGRLNYSYKDRYMAEVNVRYDGSSRFLKDQRWNVFPSFSLGWNLARESFFEPINNIINTLKPRVSWGMLGNQNTELLLSVLFNTKCNSQWWQLANGRQ